MVGVYVDDMGEGNLLENGELCLALAKHSGNEGVHRGIGYSHQRRDVVGVQQNY